MVDWREIGKRVRVARGRRTQKEFAEALGTSRGYIANIEAGTNHPSFSLLSQLAAEGFCVTWILTGVGEPRHHADAVGGAIPITEAQLHLLLSALVRLYEAGDDDYKTWMKVQLERTFPEIREELEKKRKAASAEGA